MNGRYRATTTTSWLEFAPHWREAVTPERASPFQQSGWMEAWYRAFEERPGMYPLLVTVTERETGELAMMLPLIQRRTGPFAMIEFADLDATDCNAPALGSAAPTNRDEAVAAWRQLSETAFVGADVVRLGKMPTAIGGRPNPLGLLPTVRPYALRTWSIRADGTFQDYLETLPSPYRRELRRSWRLFEQAGKAAFTVARDATDAARILAVIDELQRERLGQRNARHIFDSPQHQRLYGEVASSCELSALSALTLDGEIVAGLMALLDKPRITLVRVANRGGALARIGLGRLLMERTLAAFHAQGYTHFDFSIGDGTHKTRFGAKPEGLVEIEACLTPRGHLYTEGLRCKKALAALVRSPTLQRLRRHLPGAAPSRRK